MIRNSLLTSWGLALALCGTAGLSLPAMLPADERLGEHEALRVYVEFADGSHRGIYDPATGKGGFPNEPYDATTAMVINWHRLPGNWPERDARLRYRQVHPERSDWRDAEGESFEFWHRAERIHRVVLSGLEPNSVYAFQVRPEGQLFRFRTMPACLEQRPVSIVMAGDHQHIRWPSCVATGSSRPGYPQFTAGQLDGVAVSFPLPERRILQRIPAGPSQHQPGLGSGGLWSRRVWQTEFPITCC